MSQQCECCQSVCTAPRYMSATLITQIRQPFGREILLQIKRSEIVIEKWWNFLVAVWQYCKVELLFIARAVTGGCEGRAEGVYPVAAQSDTLSQENILLTKRSGFWSYCLHQGWPKCPSSCVPRVADLRILRLVDFGLSFLLTLFTEGAFWAKWHQESGIEFFFPIYSFPFLAISDSFATLASFVLRLFVHPLLSSLSVYL